MSDESKTTLKIAGGIVAGWFVLFSIWPVTIWWLKFLDAHLHLGGQAW